MKNIPIIIFLFLILVSNNVKAQFAEGDFLLGANVSANQINDERFIGAEESFDYYSKTLNTNLSLSYFLKDDVSITFGLSHTFTERNSSQFISSTLEYVEIILTERMTSFNLGVNKYYGISDRFSLVNGVNSSFGIGKYDPSLTNSPYYLVSDIQRLSLSLSHGFLYQLSDSFIITTSIGSLYYNYATESPENSDSSLIDTSYGINANFSSLVFGLSYKF